MQDTGTTGRLPGTAGHAVGMRSLCDCHPVAMPAQVRRGWPMPSGIVRARPYHAPGSYHEGRHAT